MALVQTADPESLVSRVREASLDLPASKALVALLEKEVTLGTGAKTAYPEPLDLLALTECLVFKAAPGSRERREHLPSHQSLKDQLGPREREESPDDKVSQALQDPKDKRDHRVGWD